eukprot:1182920-Prorocentrum_minimum.AAC.1
MVQVLGCCLRVKAAFHLRRRQRTPFWALEEPKSAPDPNFMIAVLRLYAPNIGVAAALMVDVEHRARVAHEQQLVQIRHRHRAGLLKQHPSGERRRNVDGVKALCLLLR